MKMIVARAANGAIGKDNRLLWHLPADLQHFKRLTMGHPLIMGRKTFESLPGILPGRPHWVLTRRGLDSVDPAVRTFADIASVLAEPACEEAFVIGGGSIYRALLPYADTLYLTAVGCTPEADTFFPDLDPAQWELVEDIFGTVDESNPLPHRFLTYRRR
ncbi:MAG: dihydrofolate reductase [Veillonellaceae bacterium]|nr:dihydrofolate reductase [Veillonellaceae bacterium]